LNMNYSRAAVRESCLESGSRVRLIGSKRPWHFLSPGDLERTRTRIPAGWGSHTPDSRAEQSRGVHCRAEEREDREGQNRGRGERVMEVQ
jgi:hypothetical protein